MKVHSKMLPTSSVLVAVLMFALPFVVCVAMDGADDVTAFITIEDTAQEDTANPMHPHAHQGGARPQRNNIAHFQHIEAEIGELDVADNAPTPRGGHTFVKASDSTLLLWGGCDLKSSCDTQLYSFDADLETWKVQEVSGNVPSGRMGHIAWVDKSQNPFMWVFGGFVHSSADNTEMAPHFSNELFAFHLASSRWSKPTTQGPAPSPRYQSSVVWLNTTHVLVYGGASNDKYFGDVHLFNTDTFMWTLVETSGDMPLSRESHAASVVDGHMIVYGGYHHDLCLDDVYSLDLATMTWKALPSASIGARGGHSMFTFSRTMFVVGGCDETHEQCFQGMPIMDSGESHQWGVVDGLTTITPREWTAVSQIGTRAYIFGGCLPATSCLNDLWLVEFGSSSLPTLQFVSSMATTTSKQSDAAANETTTTSPSLTTHANSTHHGNSTTPPDCVTPVPTGPPHSRPGRAMMEQLREVRRQLKLAEDVCNNLPGTGKRGAIRESSDNATLPDPNKCPDGTIPVRLGDLNFELFNQLMKENNVTTTPSKSEEDDVEESLLQVGNEIALLEVGQLSFNASSGNWSALVNTTVCFGKNGPVSVLHGGGNITIQDIFQAMSFNRTLESSARRGGGFKPSPSPSPIPRNITGGWEEQGRFMGRRVNQGKRRPLQEVAARADAMLRHLNCTSADAQLRPECTLPFANLTHSLNATANWTDISKSGADGGAGAAGGDASGTATGEASGTAKADSTGSAEGEAGSGEGASATGGGTATDAQGGTSGEAGATDEAAATAKAEEEVCLPTDVECMKRKKEAENEAACAPDDAECLKHKSGAASDVVCDPNDQACLDSKNSTAGTLGGSKHQGTVGAIMDTVSDNLPLVILGLVAFFAAFIALGAVMTAMVKEKRRLAKLESSLQDAQVKQQDEIWTRSSSQP